MASRSRTTAGSGSYLLGTCQNEGRVGHGQGHFVVSALVSRHAVAVGHEPGRGWLAGSTPASDEPWPGIAAREA